MPTPTVVLEKNPVVEKKVKVENAAVVNSNSDGHPAAVSVKSECLSPPGANQKTSSAAKVSLKKGEKKFLVHLLSRVWFKVGDI